ncbi:c-type cytochrome [Pueribacillus sp. YX66]|uniref:c-type cytochrome n=1 Tax=Pueribacillus sp. YX66 TaxID=3229242 RepID=UPI00358D8BFF
MKLKVILISGLVVALTIWIGIEISDRITSDKQSFLTSEPVQTQTEGNEISFNPPSLDDVPDGPLGEAIKDGYNLVNETHVYADDYVGNQLSCTSCHAGAGLEELGSPFVGVTTQYPQYRPREGIVFTLEDRINGCMIRSMNGKPFPNDSPEMRSMIAYFTYISEGIPVGAELPWREQNNMKEIPIPNLADGEELYQQSCVACHAVDGSGIGANTGPALWGENSFNDGAGMTRLSKMAAFIQQNMPPGGEGTFTDQEAVNIAAYILQHDRPEFADKDKDFPHGGKPSDFIDKERREQIKNGTIDWKEVVGQE